MKMKFLDFEINKNLILKNLEVVSDSARVLVINKNKSLFEKLSYENDLIFLEPTLFSLFIEKNFRKDSTLEQVLWGHINDTERPNNILVRSDAQGLIYLPNYGYLKTKKYNQEILLEIVFGNIRLSQGDKQIPFTKIDVKFLNNSQIRVCCHEPSVLTGQIKEEFRKPMLSTCFDYLDLLNNAFNILDRLAPDLHELIRLTLKEIYLFDGKKRESLAAMSFFGGVLINVDNQKHNEVFFIEDLAHQCGHVIFYTIILYGSELLRPKPDTLLKKFNLIDWEVRDIYGAFHGLFTYTTIVDTLDKCIDSGFFEGDKLLETYARLGFYLNKFQRDLSNLCDNRILTKKGFEYFDVFKSGYDKIYVKYKKIVREMYYGEQSYIFNFQIFLIENKIFVNEIYPDISRSQRGNNN